MRFLRYLRDALVTGLQRLESPLGWLMNALSLLVFVGVPIATSFNLIALPWWGVALIMGMVAMVVVVVGGERLHHRMSTQVLARNEQKAAALDAIQLKLKSGYVLFDSIKSDFEMNIGHLVPDRSRDVTNWISSTVSALAQHAPDWTMEFAADTFETVPVARGPNVYALHQTPEQVGASLARINRHMERLRKIIDDVRNHT